MIAKTIEDELFVWFAHYLAEFLDVLVDQVVYVFTCTYLFHAFLNDALLLDDQHFGVQTAAG